jgi:hypothetical protein
MTRKSSCAALVALASIACTTSAEPSTAGSNDAGSGGSDSSDADGSAGSAMTGTGGRTGGAGARLDGSGGAETSGGAAEGGRTPSGGSGAAQGGRAAGGAAGERGTGGSPKTYPPGPPGCGLAQAAFCDTFDAPAGATTRAGELDPKKWSAARFCNIGGPSGDDEAVAIGAATMPACRAGLPDKVFPSADAVICDATEHVHNNHLLVLAAAQNYGQNSYRIRQPLDFADRTATIVFDAGGHNVGLQGWISVEITEDPAPAPSFTLQQNFENGSIPRNAVEIHFAQICGGDNVGISQLFVYDDYHQNLVLSDSAVCAPAGAGKLNHFEVKLSKSHIEVHATPASSDGVTLGSAVLLGSKDVTLPFTRGYVHLTTHNHASLKYSNETVDAWTARWDNVGFDGPAIVGGFREYEALDPLTATKGGKVNVGFRVAKDADGPAQRIEIKGVDVKGAIRARLALQNWSYHPAGSTALADYVLNYRFNGRAWKKRPLTAAEQRMMTELPNAGTRSLMLDVDVADLVDGTNTVEFTTTNALPPLPPVVVNIDLIVETG